MQKSRSEGGETGEELKARLDGEKKVRITASISLPRPFKERWTCSSLESILEASWLVMDKTYMPPLK